MKPCRIGIIGAGRIGKLHAENIVTRLPQFTLAGIADPNIDLDWAQSIGVPIITTNCDDLIHHANIDAILIASPSTLHTTQVMAASRAKKAIFCEKPLGLTPEDIEAALAVVKENNSLLQIGFNRRFDPNFSSIQRRVQSDEVGVPQLVRITSRDPASPPKEYIKTSGGIFMDMVIHDFDMARFLIGSEVVEVFASGSVMINPEFAEFDDVDTAVVHLRFANGALGIIDNSREAVYGYDQRVEVFGSKGSLLAQNQRKHSVVHLNQKETRNSNPMYFFLQRYQAAYLIELESFYNAWINASTSPVSGYDGLQALRIAMAAKKSLHTKQPIRIS